jgi:hypothetical protein
LLAFFLSGAAFAQVDASWGGYNRVLGKVESDTEPGASGFGWGWLMSMIAGSIILLPVPRPAVPGSLAMTEPGQGMARITAARI